MFFNSNKDKPPQQQKQEEQKKQQDIIQEAQKNQETLKNNTGLTPQNCTNLIYIRSKQGVYSSNIFQQGTDEENRYFTGSADQMIQSQDQQYIVITQDIGVTIVSTQDKKIIYKKQFINIKTVYLNVFFFLKKKYKLKQYKKQLKYIQVIDHIDNNKYILFLYSFPDFKLINQWEHKRFIKENVPYVKFNQGEEKAFIYNYNSGFLEVINVKNNEIIQQAEMQKIDFFSLSPTHDYVVGCAPEHMMGYEKTQARLQFYNLEKGKREKVKNVEEAQEISLKWSPDGNNVCILTQAIHDQTGNSYYGQTIMLYYAFNSKKLLIIPTIEGPAHDFAWNPNSEDFMIISGYMPAKPVLYTSKCEPIFQFGNTHRNTIRYSPNGRFVLIGGFGNISGDVDIWDLKNLQKIANFKAATASIIEWGKDSRTILTAVVTPRLRVDNNFKVFGFNGDLVNFGNFTHTELYDVQWKVQEKVGKEISEEEIQKNCQQFLSKNNQGQAKTGGGGSFAAMLRSDKDDKPSKLTGQEEWILKTKEQNKKK
ncbi:hypothetical protein IMG5_049810 [Ichthyophthirius multifiliis]|uniref:Eukaryotic translation initiation factor 2A n=1 Tax=Ichthyophthirius multifiliis TaxID=5932 RepID=G0QML1_ICHMU|nr:hypothetical protein IMG5_049810 [Ichthyophthirius multifiliis]EGR33544.1 hypothetical protein IMG5_049810 [Ichthyophthirius multifiliis]|eukprot:XP_004037530.1 hypothetical protein IMG5_049810 [Ichthyophthirius multifiliis]